MDENFHVKNPRPKRHDLRLYDYVKGPLKSPMVTVPIPYEIKDRVEADGCDCARYVRECYSKPGIPDPWSEYLILRREAEKGRDASSTFPKCDLDITAYLDRHHRVYLGQGIPDPWKTWTYIEPLEPNFNDMRRDWKSHAENLRIGPGCDMYDVDNVCCPNCNRHLLVLCLKRSGREEQGGEKVAGADAVSNPVEEKLAEQKISTKDACVETDTVPETKSDEVQKLKACSYKPGKTCECGNNRSSGTVCTRSKSDETTDAHVCTLKRNSDRSEFSTKNENTRQCFPLPDQRKCPCSSKPHRSHQEPMLFLRGASDDHVCPARRFTAFEEKHKHKHSLELQLVCPKCERKKEKRRKPECNASGEQRRRECSLCHLRTHRRDGYHVYHQMQQRTNEDECECDLCHCRCNARHFKKRVEPKTGCRNEDRCRWGDSPKTGIFQDRDYLRLLEILGCTDVFLNKPDCNNPKTAGSEIWWKGKGQPFSGYDHSYWRNDMSDMNEKRFQNIESDWKDHKYTRYNMGKCSTGAHSASAAFGSRYDDKKQILRGIPYGSHNETDEFRKMRSRSRRQKNKNVFRKELNYFLSNRDRCGLSNDSSCQTEKTGRKNAETREG